MLLRGEKNSPSQGELSSWTVRANGGVMKWYHKSFARIFCAFDSLHLHRVYSNRDVEALLIKALEIHSTAVHTLYLL